MTFDDVKTDTKKGTASITMQIAKDLSGVDFQATIIATLRSAVNDLEAEYHAAVQLLRDKEMV